MYAFYVYIYFPCVRCLMFKANKPVLCQCLCDFVFIKEEKHLCFLILCMFIICFNPKSKRECDVNNSQLKFQYKISIFRCFMRFSCCSLPLRALIQPTLYISQTSKNMLPSLPFYWVIENDFPFSCSQRVTQYFQLEETSEN